MITAEQAKEKSDLSRKDAREIYLKAFDQIYKDALAKLTISIDTTIQNGYNHTYIFVHDAELVEKLEKECTELGYKVKYDKKECTFIVEW